MTEENDEKAKEEAERKEAEERAAEEKSKSNETEKVRIKREAQEKYIKKSEEAAAETRKLNEEKKEILEREEKLQDRKEQLNALGGGSPAGTESKPKFTPEELASRKRIKAVGDASASPWAKKYE